MDKKPPEKIRFFKTLHYEPVAPFLALDFTEEDWADFGPLSDLVGESKEEELPDDPKAA